MQESTNLSTDKSFSQMPTQRIQTSGTEQKSDIPRLLTFFVCMLIAAACGYFVGKSQPAPSSGQISTSVTEPEVSKTPVVTDSKSLEDLEFTYNTKKYTKTYTPYDAVNENFANIRLRDVATMRDVIIIEDISALPNYALEKDVAKISSTGGAPVESSFSPFVINGVSYDLTAEEFGNGNSTDDEGNCYQGGGVTTHFLRFSPEILVKVVEQYSETGCEGQEPKITKSLTPEKREEVVKILQSIRFK